MQAFCKAYDEKVLEPRKGAISLHVDSSAARPRRRHRERKIATMAMIRNRPRKLSALIGAVLVVGAICCVVLIRRGRKLPPEPSVVRPLKTIVVGGAILPAGRRYPGRVRANEEVDLAFQVAGPLIELPVKRGQPVEKGTLLARVDPRDYENKLAARKAVEQKRKLDVERFTKAFNLGAATEKEVDDAKAIYDMAEAEWKIATKALADTYLHAPFAGVIANTFVENFQNVQAKQPVLSLQDISSVAIEVSVPEERIARYKKGEGKPRFVITFEYLPGREFEVTIKEYATEADPVTQTYPITFVMLSPRDVTILPGMTATLQEYRQAAHGVQGAGHILPLSAVPVDGLGQYYVWALRQAEGDQYTTHRVNVKVGEMMADSIMILDGVDRGDRVAAAGVHFLQEGQRVRLLVTNREAPKP